MITPVTHTPGGFPLSGPAFVADAADFATVLAGRETLLLQGFGSESAQSAPWTHPGVPFISAPVSPMDLVPTLQAKSRAVRWLLVLMVLSACALSAAAGFMAYTVLAPGGAREVPEVKWAVKHIDPAGVTIQQKSGEVFVPLGGYLPNGDQVVSVMADRRAALLSSGIFVLHDKGEQNEK